MDAARPLHLDTRAVHAAPVDAPTGAVAPPLHLSTTYGRDADNRPLGGHVYIRESNPTQSLLEAALADLEGGEAALAFASGMAAGVALMQAMEPGSHLLLPDDAYYGYAIAAREFLPHWGLRADPVAMDDLDALRAALRPETRLVWLESPSNPLMKVVDLAPALALARDAGAVTVVDSTFATPVLTRPLELGADVVLHATTKYFGGHSDVQGGALVFARGEGLCAAVSHLRHILGSVASPFNSWLVLRGIRTLGCRMERHCANAQAVASFLEAHPAVSRVHYPGLASHPGHAVAARQMAAFGGMLSFHARGGREAALRIVGRTRLFIRATSLGGVESLIEHRATAEGPASTAPPDLVRLSLGLEHPHDLVEDLARALAPEV
jgi:cystathionine gamma-synthase